MRKKTTGMMLLLLSILPLAAQAQDNNDCVAVYSNATRNISLNTKARSERAFVYTMYCEKSSSNKDSGASAGLTFPIKGIPLNISAEGTWTEEQHKQFCDKGISENSYQTNELSYGNFVVTDALSSFNECKALATKDLILTHSENAPFGVSIFGRITNTQANIVVDGFEFNPKHLSCKSTSFTSSGKAEKVDGSKSFKLVNNFSINCSRMPVSQDGKEYYPPTSFTVSTTDGPYSVRLREDMLLGFNLASEAQAAYDSAIAAKNIANAHAAEAVKKANSTNPSIHSAYVGQGPELNYIVDKWEPCSAKLYTEKQRVDYFQSFAKSICKANRVAGFKKSLETTVGACGYHKYDFTCISLVE